MKKFSILCLTLVLGIAGLQAQGSFKAGLSAGLPIGDAGDFATFAIAIDLGYLFEINDQFEAGPTLGYSHSFGDEFDTGFGSVSVEDIQFLPIGAAGRFHASEEFTIGLDLGYALGIDDGNDGGFYYSPRAQYAVSETIDIVAAFRGVSVDGGSWDIISLGVEFGID
ncbi:outer membrane beta-barrel protein [Croceivirga thetidis]|uniref:outer membrane beta-barrel protein n=1 Tax=Croceivirga thetidis TaxID=2721623 RepID=UPI001B2FE7B0|nr:outer membrane beta-barrel protein [Croceivirga thetidis]